MYKYVATCSFGTEALLANELKSFGLTQVNHSSGAVEFSGDLEVAYKLCLWSRIASRVLLYIADFDCNDADDIYTHALDICWSDYLGVTDNFLIKGSVSKGVDINSQYALFRMKDAIADWFQSGFSKRPTVAKSKADHFFHFHINKDKRCTLYLDLVGEPLHKRAYRSESSEAPLKETLASAILQYSHWTGVEDNKLLVDPMCGSGTLLIEAALMRANVAPGSFREHFSLENWVGHDVGLWHRLRKEADASRQFDAETLDVRLYGFDASQKAVDAAQANAKKAGVESLIHFEKRELHGFSIPGDRRIDPSSAYFITNPPYGERLGEAEQLKYLYKSIGHCIKRHCQNWNVSIFSSNNELLDQLGVPVKNRVKLFNGAIKCQLAILDAGEKNVISNGIIDFEKPRELPGLMNDQVSLDFSNRLIKNYKGLKKWLLQNNLSCYRLYDRDIPEYNVVVDVYGDRVHLQEYKPPKTIDDETARKRLKQIITSLISVFGIDRNNIHLKQRERQKGNKQYKQLNTKKKYLEVVENDLLFLANFTDYIDTGIFLDHRYIRNYIRSISRGKNFLNLFSYTATASVYAASGGAKSTTSIDLSNNYTEWAINNLLLNGFSLDNHQAIQADSISWLQGLGNENNAKNKFDLVFVDPPTFSNSKKLTGDFNVQDDHRELLLLCKKRLAKDGVIIFSNNFKDFVLDSSLSNYFEIENISELTISKDFSRHKKSNKKIHNSWVLKPL